MPKPPPETDGSPPVPLSLLGDDKRTLILRGAHRLFLRDGFSETSMDAVTHEAGVSKATVYAHFPGKRKLFEEVVKAGAEGMLEAIPKLIRSGGDPTLELLAFFEPFLAAVFGGGYAWSRMVIAEAGRNPSNAVFFYTCTIGRLTTILEQYLGELDREGVLKAPDIPMAATVFLDIVLLGPLHRLLLLGPESVDYSASLRFGIKTLVQGASPAHAGDSWFT